MSQERGPNYDWKHEAEHYRVECDKLRDLLHKVEVSGDELKTAHDDMVELNKELQKLLKNVMPTFERQQALLSSAKELARLVMSEMEAMNPDIDIKLERWKNMTLWQKARDWLSDKRESIK